MKHKTTNYNQLLTQVGRLERIEQFRLAQVILQRVVAAERPEPRQRLSDLKGLGAEIWQPLDAQAYVKKERQAWHG